MAWHTLAILISNSLFVRIALASENPNSEWSVNIHLSPKQVAIAIASRLSVENAL